MERINFSSEEVSEGFYVHRYLTGIKTVSLHDDRAPSAADFSQTSAFFFCAHHTALAAK